LYMENPVLIRATIVFEQNLVVKDYTAKLVKSLLINSNPLLEEIFTRREGPKPIHITPLYTYKQNEKTGEKQMEPVYTRYIPTGSTSKPPGINRIKPIELKAGREYFFYIGTNASLLNLVLLGLSNVDRFDFGSETVAINRLDFEVKYIDIEREAERIESILESSSNGYLKIVFESPTLLKDPLAIARWKKKKLFFPLPEAVFSTPFYMALLDTGRYKTSLFKKCMVYVKSAFDIPYTALKTINLVWYIYDAKPLPALIGYTKYYIDTQLLNHIKNH